MSELKESDSWSDCWNDYREFLAYANFITANFVTAVFQNYYYNFANAILWAIYFVSAFIS